MTTYPSPARPLGAGERAGSLPPPRRRSVAWRIRRNWSAYAFLSVPLLLFMVFTVFALIFAFYLTFHEWNALEPETPYVGLRNYSDMIADEGFRGAIVNTFYFTAVSVPVTMAIGLLVALLLNLPLRGRGFLRTLYFLPVVTPFVVVAILWKWLYNGDFGLFNFYLLKTHLIDSPLLFLSDQKLAMPSVILMSIWSGVGFSMVIYLAALQAIPEDLYEAARVDGASGLSRLLYITVPMLRPTTLFLAVIGIIGAFQVFTQIFVMTSGGPAEKTTTVVYFIYLAAFKFYEFGYASTLSFGLLAILLVFTIIQLRIYRKGDA
ncbi:carbohydrate ABC transporter permease [uncultured Friedmanniella sp.]|uniref:carbohydrate ABC transporter permease n=1 Tax=uncultured Friedmanniella sp. TaxID=335381 RepID=UPI0035CB16CC